VYVAIEEPVEDFFCAELVGEKHYRMAFGAVPFIAGALLVWRTRTDPAAT